MSRKNRRLFPLLVALAFAAVALPARPGAAQEFNCTASINSTALSGNEFGFLGELKQEIEEYINRQTWTDDRFQEHERIDCTIQVTFEEAISLTSFKARLIVASRRPVYGTTQNSIVTQFNDANWIFGYVQGGALAFDPERYDPLTSVLDFYAYLMLGYDYDTFSEMGGTRHFERARRVAERAQAQSAAGWAEVGSDRGRMNLITQILDPRFRPLRKAYFDYHFAGLDHFVIEPDGARTRVISVLESINELFDLVSRQFAIDLFFSAKYQELAGLFDDSPQRSQAYNLLVELDPSHQTEYNKLVQ